MKLYNNILALIAGVAAVSGTTATVEYTKNGVLRKENKCNINFINCGLESTVKNIGVSLSGTTLTISKLLNVNEGVNNIDFPSNEISKYVEVTQNGKALKFSVTPGDSVFSLKINDVKSCEGITVKQKYKYDVLVHTYLLYANKIPNPINKGFPSDQFGPSSNDVPYDKLYWNMNNGLDQLREQCGIFVDYRSRAMVSRKYHYVWYLSTENVNLEKCDNKKFYEIVRKNFPKYDYMKELFGENYEGYVLKRESGLTAHMDGIINSNFIIEVYQEACGNQSDNQVICTISSGKELSFKDFTSELQKNCLSIIVDKEEVGKWTVNKDYINAQFSKYSLRIKNNNNGELPTTESGVVKYKTFKATNSSGVARFKVSLVCNDGTYRDDKCRCQACTLGCTLCDSATKCNKCKDKSSSLINGVCECPKGTYMDKNGECKQCGKDCATCSDANTCTSCKESTKLLKEGKCECGQNQYEDKNGKCVCNNGFYKDEDGDCMKCKDGCETCTGYDKCTKCTDELKIVKDGQCVCPEGYSTSVDGKCIKCPAGCKQCNEKGCVECEGKNKVPNDEGECVCKTSYFENPETKNCERCSASCATCNVKGKCTSCKDERATISDGVCVCKNSYHAKDGMCFICDKSCKVCDKNGCVVCADSSKTPVNGKC
jgi:hypothetical protein